jgi:hypothetical protein
MNVFELDQALVNDYERFARSFTQIRAPDIQRQVEALYASDRFWPEPLISINPRFERGVPVDRLVASGSLCRSDATSHIIRPVEDVAQGENPASPAMIRIKEEGMW